VRLAIFMAAIAMSLFGQEAADRFRDLLRKNQNAAILQQAAAQWESNEPDPARHLLAVLEIARAFLDQDPSLSLAYCRKIQSAPQLWPLMFEAEVHLRDWPMAERYGDALIEEIDAGRLFPRLSDTAEESRIRRLYATALDHQGKTTAAQLQKSIADNDGEGVVIAARERARRLANLKTEVLAGEIHQPSTPFRLPDLNGRNVALADYHGQPLVVIFWATWCAPCIEELRQAQAFVNQQPDHFLTVSLDAAGEFARKHNYRFPILSADHSTEYVYALPSSLDGSSVPQLYIFDPQGNIRFHVIGFEDDGMLSQKLDWMIEAAVK
jgi:peroxiredoxin